MIKAYNLKHSINIGKQKKVFEILSEYRSTGILLSKIISTIYMENGRFNKKLKIFLPESKISARYKQVIQYQVVGQLESYISNRQNEFVETVFNSSISEKILIELLYINKYKKWFLKNIEMRKKIISEEIIKLARKIFKKILSKNRKPNFRYMNMALDSKVVNIEKKLENRATKFDYWLNLSTLEKGKKIKLPIDSNSYFEGKIGNIKNFVQFNFGKKDKIGIVFLKDIDKIEYIPKTDKIGLDLGLKNLFATNRGDIFGRGFSKIITKYNTYISELAKNRQKQKLKTASKRYKNLIQKLRNYLKNEINRVVNNIIKIYKPKEIIIERLDFKSPKLSKKLNRLISNFGKKIITDKFKNLKDEFGIIITEVNPAYTSQTCSKCGYVDKRNRKNQETFICGFCHKKQNADINASKNILVRSSNELKDIFAKKAFILDKTVKCFIEQHKVMLLFILKKDIGESNVNNLSYNSLANTLTSNSYLKTILNDEFLSEKAIPF